MGQIVSKLSSLGTYDGKSCIAMLLRQAMVGRPRLSASLRARNRSHCGHKTTNATVGSVFLRLDDGCVK